MTDSELTQNDGGNVQICDECGTAVDARGFHNHKGSYKCAYLADQKQIEEEDLVKLDFANPKIKAWLDENTEFGVIELRSNYEEGGPTWKPKTHYANYTSQNAWEKFLRENRLTNPEKQADERVNILNFDEIETEDGDWYGLNCDDMDAELKADRIQKGWMRDGVVYDNDGNRLGTHNLGVLFQ